MHYVSIKNLPETRPVVWRVKIGKKGNKKTSSKGGTYFETKKLDHFEVVFNKIGEDSNFIRDEEIEKKVIDKDGNISIFLRSDTIEDNFSSNLLLYDRSKQVILCEGDGERAMRRQEDGKLNQIKCDRFNCEYWNRKDSSLSCRFNGIFNFYFTNTGLIGGIAQYRTHSYETIAFIETVLKDIKDITGGKLTLIPLKLCLFSKLDRFHNKKGEKECTTNHKVYVAFDWLKYLKLRRMNPEEFPQLIEPVKGNHDETAEPGITGESKKLNNEEEEEEKENNTDQKGSTKLTTQQKSKITSIIESSSDYIPEDEKDRIIEKIDGGEINQGNMDSVEKEIKSRINLRKEIGSLVSGAESSDRYEEINKIYSESFNQSSEELKVSITKLKELINENN